MAPSRIRITGARITPVAFVDPPLLNTVGVHQPYALRAIIQLDTDAGLVGLGETYADQTHLARLAGRRRRDHRPGRVRAQRDPRGDRRPAARRHPCRRHRGHDHHRQRRRPGVLAVRGRLPRRAGPRDRAGPSPTCSAARSATPCRSAPTCSTSGRRTPAVSPTRSARPSTRTAIVAQATAHHRRIRLHRNQTQGRRVPSRGGDGGHRGAARGLPRPPAAAGPERGVDTADVGQGGVGSGRHPRVPRGPDARPRRDGRGRAAGADAAGDQHVRRRVRPARARGRERARCAWCFPITTTGVACSARACSPGICDTFGLGLSMHSNSHLGISLAAMVHLAGATPNLTYACDTHWPWKTEEIVKPGALEFVDGSVRRADDAGPRASRSTTTRWPRCTSSTCAAGSATATTPAT